MQCLQIVQPDIHAMLLGSKEETSRGFTSPPSPKSPSDPMVADAGPALELEGAAALVLVVLALHIGLGAFNTAGADLICVCSKSSTYSLTWLRRLEACP